MRVQLYGSSGISTELEAEATWTHSGMSGQFGTAQVLIDRSSVAWNPDIIDEMGGMLVQIQHGNLPVWRGVADRPRYRPAGIELDCVHIERWVRIRQLESQTTLYGATPGLIVSAAFRQALSGSQLPVRRGAICMSGPHVDEYQLSGTFEDVLSDMVEWSGMVWEIDDQWRFNWQHDLGRFHEEWLTDDGVLFNELRLGDLADQYAEVIEVHGDGQTQRVQAEDTPYWWPSQRTERV